MNKVREYKKLKHHHLIDGKYLQEDVIPSLRQMIDEEIMHLIPEILHARAQANLDILFAIFEDECVSYDRSQYYEEKSK